MSEPNKPSALALLIAFTASGCFLLNARSNNLTMEKIVSLKGTVTSRAVDEKPLYVVLLKETQLGWKQFSHRLLYKSGPFEFSCVTGRYLLVAFEDVNGDLELQPDEPVARFGSADGMVLEEGAHLDKLDLEVGALKEPLDFPVSVAESGTLAAELVQVHRGDTVKLDDERFTDTSGELGFWQPVDFALKYGIGVSFLEDYSPQKVPVLFVHGAEGTPTNFTPLIAKLDRTKFQAWVYSYPSGIRLPLASMTLRRIMDDLQQKLGFSKVYVVAHSMGGLVARDFVTQVVETAPKNYIGLLVTISSPFGGVAAAKSGVKTSPVVLPSWIDIAEGSDFLTVMHQKPLPADLPYYLFFSFEGGRGSDGTIALKSQLEETAQKGAKQVQGFPEDHMSILSSKAVSQKLNDVLAAP